MEAIYKLKASEINSKLMDTIKKLFSNKEITIIITSRPDETTYLTMSPTNEKTFDGKYRRGSGHPLH